MLAVPPDQSREHSRAGLLTRYAWDYYGEKLGRTARHRHAYAMSSIRSPPCFAAFRGSFSSVHNWRTDIETLGEIPAEFICEQSEGKLITHGPRRSTASSPQGGFDLILSIGQVVPHEVIGMANYTKNILVGTGGRESINRSHYLGAVYGMERIMGRADNPVRNVLNLSAAS